MDFMNRLLDFFWQLLTWGGGIIAIVGIFRWVQHGASRDGAEQTNDVWLVAAGAVACAIGAIAGNYLSFPTIS